MKRDNQIVAWLKAEQKESESLSETFFRILKNKAKGSSFLDTVVNNPRDNKSAYRKLLRSFSGREDKQKCVWAYQKVYAAYMNDRLKQAEAVEEIVKVMPNLLPWTLEQRFSAIKIGQIPDSFGDEKLFLDLIRRINKSRAVRIFKRIKKLECHLPDFRKAFPEVNQIDWFDFSARSDFLKQLLKDKCGSTFNIKLNNAVYAITFLCNPFSNKMVFDIKTPSGKEFIVKEAPYQFLKTPNDRIRKEHENMAIRADSTYSDAMLEFYLKLNGCRHAPDILYYNFNHEVALYSLECGKPFKFRDGFNGNKDFYTFNTQVIPDAACLGVYVNDINEGNFLVSDTDGEVKIIDIGHATFVNPLTPGVPGLTFTLGNLCGQDYISVNGVMEMEDV